MIHAMYLFEVKSPAESKEPWDYYKLKRTVPAERGIPPDQRGWLQADAGPAVAGFVLTPTLHPMLAAMSNFVAGAGGRRGRGRESPASRHDHRCAMIGATLMQALDQTIANVALPYMQGSLSASYDEITWVLTSYITAAAIMTAPVGWLAARFGRKQLFVGCLVGFTVASMLCGAAQSLARWWCSACCRACSARRWCRCRRPRCWTSTRPSSAARRWRSGAWA